MSVCACMLLFLVVRFCELASVRFLLLNCNVCHLSIFVTPVVSLDNDNALLILPAQKPLLQS